MGERAEGRSGAFLLGMVFSFGFIPTMVFLYFGMVMPLSLQSSYDIILPPFLL
jgi:cytochrome c-type biogenesis protein